MPSDFENTVENFRKSLTDSGLRATETDVPPVWRSRQQVVQLAVGKNIGDIAPTGKKPRHRA